ncbi:RNA ligase-domain-containing protein, partial [Syncephalis pseudoplumigaleata]
ESSYWRTPCPLPTMARGLFIHTKRRAYEIVIRGYDKFFSIDETPSTKMEALKRDMMGPYEVSTKENGCIVFIAALSPTRLVVTSKNSLGDEDAPSHPQVGRQWLLRHLAEANRTQQEFCQFLHDQQVTAVFELCDDAFEEHIVAYPPSRRGLYLHGINRNTVELQTWPMEQVERVARAFGFHMVKYHVYHTLDDVLSYCRSIESEQSIYDNGEQIEGFVLTKGLLAGRNVSPRYAWTVDYLEWCRKARKQHPELFEGYQHNHGIIAVRNAFLEWWMAQG